MTKKERSGMRLADVLERFWRCSIEMGEKDLSQYKAIVMKAADNVATVTEDIAAGTTIQVPVEGTVLSILVTENIRFGHKIAIRPIANGEKIVKYGAVIGAATADIAPGQHTHVHNLGGCRGRGDLTGE